MGSPYYVKEEGQNDRLALGCQGTKVKKEKRMTQKEQCQQDTALAII